jgi:dienelactone hydrolase
MGDCPDPKKKKAGKAPRLPAPKADCAGKVKKGRLICYSIAAMFRRLIAAALALAAFAPPAFAQAQEIYRGGYGVPGDFRFTVIDLAVAADGAVGGRIRQAFDRRDEPAIADLRREGDALAFTAGKLRFDLKRTAHGYAGTVIDEKGRRRPAAFLLRVPPPRTELVATYEGTYRVGRGRTLTLSRNVASPGLWYLELPSGRTGYLYNLSDREFVAGRCLYCVAPEYLRLRFPPAAPGTRIAGFEARIAGREYAARRLTSYTEREVTFRSADGTLLAGSLFLPAGKAAHPAVVFAHGSSAQTRNGYEGQIRFLAEAYARKGIAALAFDKRGTGGSQGDWEKAGLALLGEDVAAGVRYLRTRPDIRADRIGLTGSSQSGWIMPLATRHVPDVVFIQHRSAASPLGVREQERRRLELQMRFDDYPEAEIARALRIRDMMDDYAVTGRGWPELEAEAAKVAGEYWMSQFIGGLPARDAPDWAWLRDNVPIDTIPDFVAFRGAWDVLYGGRDPIAPLKAGRAALEAALKRGRSRDVTIEVIPDATHNYLEARIGSDRELPGLVRFVPGFHDRVVDWAAKRLR